MEGLDVIYTRRSIRRFDDRPVEASRIHEILRAGMSGPCCVNAREWEFIVVTDHDKLCSMADANGSPAQLLKKAPAAIMVCANLDRAFRNAPEYWITDCAIAAQNICLAAHALGIGAVWLGTYPQMERVKKQAELFSLPENIVPHSIIALGYPKKNEKFPVRDQYEEDKAHFEKW